MEFFRGFLAVLIFYAFCGSLMFFAKEFGIKRGRELASKEMNLKLKNCQRILTSGN